MTRAAIAGDAARIVELVRAGFEPEMLARFIYGCSGIERYIDRLAADSARGSDTQFMIAESNGEVVGCIEMRLLGDLFLNYVAVDERFRERGIANRMLADAIRSLRRPHHVRLALDVLSNNRAACAWYDSLEIGIDAITSWYEMSMPAPRPATLRAAGEIAITGLAQARICHEELGFSQLTLASPGASTVVGMLGDHWFRTTSAELLGDAAMLARLHQLDPKRGLLALIPSGVVVPPTCREVASTQRRSAPLAGLIVRLEAAR